MDLEKTFAVGNEFLKRIRQSNRYLVATSGPQKGRHVGLSSEPLLIGRKPDAGLRLDDPAVSGRHCEVRVEGTRVLARDLGSTNGTFLDETRLEEERELAPGAVLQVGRSLLRLELIDADEVKRRETLADELRRASAYVQSLLPPPLASGPVRAAWRFIPSAELGGDAFGYHRLGDDRTAIYLLDVCGHGAGAALHSVSAMNILRSRSLPGVDFACPAEVLTALNGTFQMDDHGGMYFTIWYGVYEHGSRRLRYASAGHPPGLLLAPDRSGVEKLQVKNMPIGITEDATFREDAVEAVPPGTGLVLYSDGTYEVMTAEGEDLGAEAFAEIVASPLEEGVPDPVRIEREIRRRTGAELFDDDFSVLHVEFA